MFRLGQFWRLSSATKWPKKCLIVGGAGFGLMSTLVAKDVTERRKPNPTRLPVECPRISFYYVPYLPNCGRIRAVLEYYGIPHNNIFVNPTGNDELLWAGENGMLPLVVFDGQLLTKANAIVRIALKELFYYDLDDVDRLWQERIEGGLNLTLERATFRNPSLVRETTRLYDNWGYGWWRNFIYKYITPYSSVMMLRYSAWNMKLYPKDEIIGVCNKIAMDVKVQGKSFLGGEAPCVSDVEVWGTFSAISHTSEFRVLLKESLPDFALWFDRMTGEMEKARVRHADRMAGKCQYNMQQYLKELRAWEAEQQAAKVNA